mmetsp:Transcript_34657/g.53049  ORF Transcript_34657/g.53049 Transcript_34657/m.53049 type:complete len:130 (+) Transcript_34657:2782-3171(+)
MSIVSDKPVAENLGMTGEITTLGDVISIGGVREKLTACKDHQITRVVLPIGNKKDVKKLPDEFKKGFTIFYVRNVDQLYHICFMTESTQKEFSSLEEMGVEVEQFEEDQFMEEVLNHEQIWEDNRIEEL